MFPVASHVYCCLSIITILEPPIRGLNHDLLVIFQFPERMFFLHRKVALPSHHWLERVENANLFSLPPWLGHSAFPTQAPIPMVGWGVPCRSHHSQQRHLKLRDYGTSEGPNEAPPVWILYGAGIKVSPLSNTLIYAAVGVKRLDKFKIIEEEDQPKFDRGVAAAPDAALLFS